MGTVVVPITVVDARLVVNTITVERALATFSVDIILRMVRIRSTVPVLRTGKVGVPVNVDLAV
jgi:hypothetical protein